MDYGVHAARMCMNVYIVDASSHRRNSQRIHSNTELHADRLTVGTKLYLIVVDRHTAMPYCPITLSNVQNLLVYVAVALVFSPANIFFGRFT